MKSLSIFIDKQSAHTNSTENKRNEMSISIKEYFALAGSRFTNDDARVIGPVLQELAADGDVAESAVVQAAHSPQCPLHRYFEWDDAVAAGRYREGQAREMIQAVRVRFVTNGKEFATRAYNIAIRKNDGNLPRETVVNVLPHPIEQLMTALRELDTWRLKYTHLSALRRIGEVLVPLTNQIEEFRADVAGAALPVDVDSALTELLGWKAKVDNGADLTSLWGEHIRFMLEAIEAAWDQFAIIKADKFLREKVIEQENDELRERITFLEELLVGVDFMPPEFKLTGSEERIVRVLLARDMATRDHLVHALYSERPNEIPEMKILDVMICNIRPKLAPFGISIETKWGQGWFMETQSKAELRAMIEARKAAA